MLSLSMFLTSKVFYIKKSPSWGIYSKTIKELISHMHW